MESRQNNNSSTSSLFAVKNGSLHYIIYENHKLFHYWKSFSEKDFLGNVHNIENKNNILIAPLVQIPNENHNQISFISVNEIDRILLFNITLQSEGIEEKLQTIELLYDSNVLHSIVTPCSFIYKNEIILIGIENNGKLFQTSFSREDFTKDIKSIKCTTYSTINIIDTTTQIDNKSNNKNNNSTSISSSPLFQAIKTSQQIEFNESSNEFHFIFQTRNGEFHHFFKEKNSFSSSSSSTSPSSSSPYSCSWNHFPIHKICMKNKKQTTPVLANKSGFMINMRLSKKYGDVCEDG
jgi:hypothetical protein